MAWTNLQSFTDTGNSSAEVVYQRDDTNDGGAGTAGRHRLIVNDIVGTAYPAGQTAQFDNGGILRYEATSYDPRRTTTGVYEIPINVTKGQVYRKVLVGYGA